jgi:predicted Zn finger-like uncharacterized protein
MRGTVCVEEAIMASTACPHCSQAFDVAADSAGKTVQCPQCKQTFTPVPSAVASGEPPTRTANSETGITDTAPLGRPERHDHSEPRERRDIGKKSSLALPIAIVAGVAALALCVCGAPAAVFFLALIPHRVARQEAAVAEARVELAQAQADEQVAIAKEQVAKAKEVANGLRGFAKGSADAKDAIAKEKLLLKEHPPLPAPGWHGEYIKLLKDKCKCDYIVIGQPKLPKEQVEEIRGWNETMQSELRRRHGETIIADLHKEAESRWRDRIKAKENR